MARYKFLGEPPFSFVETMGPTNTIIIPLKDGGSQTLEGPPGGFVVDQDIGHDITDSRAIRSMDVDIRFERI
jgi:hypothetical protein